jgi:purine-binding chemotaxis protein CheW
MNGKPSLDDYFDALLGEPVAAPVSVAEPAPAGAPAAPPPAPVQQPVPLQAPVEPAPLSAPLGDPLDELEAVFEQAHAEAKAAGVFNQAAPATAAAPAAPLGDPLDELEAVFEQAHAAAKAAGVFDQAAPATAAAPAAPLGDPLDELEAVFEQAHAAAKVAGVFNQAATASAAAPAAPPGDPLDELEALFEQAHAEAKAAGVFAQATPSKAAAVGPDARELDELEAAFDAAAEAARLARQAAVAAAPPLPSHVPLPGPAETPPQHGLLKPQLAKRSEAVRRRLARRRQPEVTEDAPLAVEKFHRWLRFQMGGQSYAVELLKVQEVQRVPDILPVRGAAPHVMGVMNLRGQIIAVIDLGACIGLPHEPLTEASRVIVLETDEETVGLLVGAVAEVISLSERAVENPVSSIPALPREALIGIARHGSHMSVLLDATVFLR